MLIPVCSGGNRRGNDGTERRRTQRLVAVGPAHGRVYYDTCRWPSSTHAFECERNTTRRQHTSIRCRRDCTGRSSAFRYYCYVGTARIHATEQAVSRSASVRCHYSPKQLYRTCECDYTMGSSYTCRTVSMSSSTLRAIVLQSGGQNECENVLGRNPSLENSRN